MGTEGTIVGTGVSGGSVNVGAGVGLGCASVGVGVAVRGATVARADGDELGGDDDEGDGLADGAATRCEEITAAPRRSRATNAIAAKTVNTVDQRSAGRRAGGAFVGGGATFTLAGGRSSCAVSSGSTRVGSRSTGSQSARVVPNGRTLDPRRLRAMEQVRQLVPEDGKTHDDDHSEEHHAHQIVNEFVSLHA